MHKAEFTHMIHNSVLDVNSSTFSHCWPQNNKSLSANMLQLLAI